MRKGAAAVDKQDKKVSVLLYADWAAPLRSLPLEDIGRLFLGILDYITTGAAPSIETLQAIMIKLLNQKDPFGDSIMVQPRYVIVPVGYGFLMSQILETAQIDVDGIGSHTANALYQYRNRLQVIEEGTLNALAGSNAVPWFVAGDPTYARSIQVDYLNGQETPTIRRMEVAGQLGYVWDIWLDWGITAVDFRGIAKNPGTTITL